MAQSQFADSLRSFRSGDITLAETVIKNDEKINQLEITLDGACSHLIVRRQPTANDLRMVIATLKIITDLERIGDESSRIARAAKNLSERGPNFALNHYEAIHLMARHATELLDDALNAFSRMDDVHASYLLRGIG